MFGCRRGGYKIENENVDKNINVNLLDKSIILIMVEGIVIL